MNTTTTAPTELNPEKVQKIKMLIGKAKQKGLVKNFQHMQELAKKLKTRTDEDLEVLSKALEKGKKI